MRLWLFGLALIIVAGPSSQTSSPQSQASGLAALKGIADAESEGRTHPRATAPADRDLTALNTSGSSDRKCVEVGTSETVRSGDFVAGNFAYYPRIYRQGLGKLFWIPAHWPELTSSGWPQKGDMPLTVRVTRLDTTALSQTYNYTTWAKPVGTAGDLFVPSGLRLPEPGKWMLVATAGPNWGCFIYELLKQ